MPQLGPVFSSDAFRRRVGPVSYTHLDVYKRQFFLWQSKVDGHLTCAQTSPGEGWIRFTGPFRDAGCRVAHDAPVNRR